MISTLTYCHFKRLTETLSLPGMISTLTLYYIKRLGDTLFLPRYDQYTNVLLSEADRQDHQKTCALCDMPYVAGERRLIHIPYNDNLSSAIHESTRPAVVYILQCVSTGSPR